MLAVGIDWAEAFHLIALGRPGEGVTEVRRVEHTPAAIQGLVAYIASLEPDPAEVRVVIETRHGLLVEQLVEQLVDAGYTVLPVNPDLVARRRGAGQKERRRRGRPDLLPAGVGPLYQPATADPPWRGGRRAALDRS